MEAKIGLAEKKEKKNVIIKNVENKNINKKRFYATY